MFNIQGMQECHPHIHLNLLYLVVSLLAVPASEAATVARCRRRAHKVHIVGLNTAIRFRRVIILEVGNVSCRELGAAHFFPSKMATVELEHFGCIYLIMHTWKVSFHYVGLIYGVGLSFFDVFQFFVVSSE